jgi:hypothetical protein
MLVVVISPNTLISNVHPDTAGITGVYILDSLCEVRKDEDTAIMRRILEWLIFHYNVSGTLLS